MSNFQVEVISPDLMRQMELLKLYPEIYERNMYPAMQGATRDLGAKISGDIPTLTGLARSTFRNKATKSGGNIEGRIGWFGSNKAFYIRFVEYGTSRITARKFMEKGYEAGKDEANQKISDAANRIVSQLAVP